VTDLPDQIDRDVVIVGGCGHVGLPLALAFADRDANVGIYDISQASVDTERRPGMSEPQTLGAPGRRAGDTT
jgi:UDP-N-acetyl-D-mannosaminuronate dehydrogenase